MRFVLALGLIATFAACTRDAATQPSPASTTQNAAGGHASGALTPEIQSVLNDIRAADKGDLAVSEEDGRFLRTLIAARGAKSILEIGGASGYSGIWLGLGARETGGKVVTIEYDPQRAKALVQNIQRAGLTDVVRPIAGDAFTEIPKLEGNFDFVFLDAWKPDYLKFFEMVFPRLTPGGVFTAHNVINKKEDMQPFLQRIQSDPHLFTSIVSPGSEGVSISVKLR